MLGVLFTMTTHRVFIHNATTLQSSSLITNVVFPQVLRPAMINVNGYCIFSVVL